VDNGEPIVITGEDKIRAVMWIRLAHMLALEVNTGMSHSRGSAMKAANQLSGSTKRTKRGALKDYVAWLRQQIDWEPSPGIVRAMGGGKNG